MIISAQAARHPRAWIRVFDTVKRHPTFRHFAGAPADGETDRYGDSTVANGGGAAAPFADSAWELRRGYTVSPIGAARASELRERPSRRSLSFRKGRSTSQ